MVSLTHEGISVMYLLRKWSTSLDVASKTHVYYSSQERIVAFIPRFVCLPIYKIGAMLNIFTGKVLHFPFIVCLINFVVFKKKLLEVGFKIKASVPKYNPLVSN